MGLAFEMANIKPDLNSSKNLSATLFRNVYDRTLPEIQMFEKFGKTLKIIC